MGVRKIIGVGVFIQSVILLACFGCVFWWLGGQSGTGSMLPLGDVFSGICVGLGISVVASIVVWSVFAAKIGTAFADIRQFVEKVAAGDFGLHMDSARYTGEISETVDAVDRVVTSLNDRLEFSNGVLDAISDAYPFMTVDSKGLINLMGRRLMEVSGKTGRPEDYNGMTIGGFVYGDNSRKTRTDRVVTEGIKIDGETYIEGFGKTHTLAFTADPIRDSRGNQIGALTIYFDLTQIREQEEQIREHSEQISQVAEQALSIAEEVAESAQIIATQVKDASDGAHVQSDRAQETAAAMEQMNITSMEVARHASDAADNASSARQQAQEGQDEVTKLISSIESVNTEANNLSGFMDKLGEQTHSVGSVINVIQDIADQTNLLALNAAIEAARAGEAGRGFAVVADEVRKLAEKTMEATSEVGGAIKAIQSGADQSISGVRLANEAVSQSTALAQNSGQTLRSIVDSVMGTADQVHSIATAAEEQSATADQVSQAIEDVTMVATNTAKGMEEANVASARLADQALQLQNLIQALHEIDMA